MAIARTVPILLLTTLFLMAAEPEGFAIWKAGDLQKKEKTLTLNMRSDHSGRDTLADYGDHRFRILYRDADGYPEQHDRIVDIVMVQSGEGTLVMGGKVIDLQPTGGAGEWKGSRLEGGTNYALGPGDIIHIPSKIPHSFLVPKGKHITYVLLKIPAK